MCEFISFLHRPDNGDIAVWDLNSHSNTQYKLNLHEPLWCEGHYLPDGEIVCRIHDKCGASCDECVERLRNKFPSFLSFLNWCFSQNIDKIKSLYLSSLTSAQGLTLPQGIKTLYLSSLTSAKGLTLPQGIKWLDLRGLTSAQGLTLPQGIEWLDLDGLTSAKGLTLPQGIETLHLNGLTSAQGLTLPQGIKELDLRNDIKRQMGY
jgi:hypothetical protein